MTGYQHPPPAPTSLEWGAFYPTSPGLCPRDARTPPSGAPVLLCQGRSCHAPAHPPWRMRVLGAHARARTRSHTLHSHTQTCMHTQTHLYTDMHTHTHILTHSGAHLDTQICMHTHTGHTLRQSDMRTHTHSDTQTQACAHSYTHAQTFRHACTDTLRHKRAHTY